jgi:hypothetical protein
MRNQEWDRNGKLVGDLEYHRKAEGLICHDNINGTERHATSAEVERWNQLEKMRSAILTTPPCEQIKPAFLKRLWKAVRG